MAGLVAADASGDQSRRFTRAHLGGESCALLAKLREIVTRNDCSVDVLEMGWPMCTLDTLRCHRDPRASS